MGKWVNDEFKGKLKNNISKSSHSYFSNPLPTIPNLGNFPFGGRVLRATNSRHVDKTGDFELATQLILVLVFDLVDKKSLRYEGKGLQNNK